MSEFKKANKDQVKEESLVENNIATNNKVNNRPLTFKDYIGQKNAVENLKVFIEAAKIKDKPIPHIIIQGEAGLGKTSLATIVANEMGSRVFYTSAPAIEKPYELVMLLNKLEKNDIIFIDEIHRLKINIEEMLYLAMEDKVVDIVIKKDFEDDKLIRLPLEDFTLIGATTKIGSLSKPLIDRFKINLGLKKYTILELVKIVENASKKNDIIINKNASKLIADRSRGIARIALKNFELASSYAIVKNDSKINIEIARESMDKMGVLKYGLTSLDVEYIKILGESTKPMSLKTISNILCQSEENVENIIEPYLISMGLITINSSGRTATNKIKEMIGDLIEDENH